MGMREALVHELGEPAVAALVARRPQLLAVLALAYSHEKYQVSNGGNPGDVDDGKAVTEVDLHQIPASFNVAHGTALCRDLYFSEHFRDARRRSVLQVTA